jgi:aminopeptidase
MPDPRVERLAQVLVDYSVEVRPEQRVALLGSPLAEPLLRAVYARVLERGAFPHLMLTLPGLDPLYLSRATEAQLDYVSPFLETVYTQFDRLISVNGIANTRELSGVDPARQARRRQALAKLQERFFERTAAGEMMWVGTQFPTDALAQDAEMSLADYEDFVYGACHVGGAGEPVAHWQAVHAEQQRLIEWLRPRRQVAVRGPNADLTLSIEGRTFVNASGKRNMPDGEIFTGPVEDSVDGWVRFSYPAIAFGREIEGIELRFESGRVVSATAQKNQDFLLSALDTDEGARTLGEFAIGTNTGIQRFTRSILFDEKIGGTIHMALGAGFPDTGSRNRSGLHWDMICDMREGGEIWMDGELFYQSGEFKV